MIKNILLILLMFISINVISQKIVTNNINTMVYKNNVLDEQIVTYDTTTTFYFNLPNYKLKINNTTYKISEYALNQPNNVYIILVEWERGGFVTVLYYFKKKLVLIKYLHPGKIYWYY